MCIGCVGVWYVGWVLDRVVEYWFGGWRIVSVAGEFAMWVENWFGGLRVRSVAGELARWLEN